MGELRDWQAEEIKELEAEVERLTKGVEVISNSFYGATECPNCGEAATIAQDILEGAVYLGSDTAGGEDE